MVFFWNSAEHPFVIPAIYSVVIPTGGRNLLSRTNHESEFSFFRCTIFHPAVNLDTFPRASRGRFNRVGATPGDLELNRRRQKRAFRVRRIFGHFPREQLVQT